MSTEVLFHTGSSFWALFQIQCHYARDYLDSSGNISFCYLGAFSINLRVDVRFSL